jgi:hypothetical protein
MLKTKRLLTTTAFVIALAGSASAKQLPSPCPFKPKPARAPEINLTLAVTEGILIFASVAGIHLVGRHRPGLQ